MIRVPMKCDRDPLALMPAELRFAELYAAFEQAEKRIAARPQGLRDQAGIERLRQLKDHVRVLRSAWRDAHQSGDDAV